MGTDRNRRGRPAGAWCPRTVRGLLVAGAVAGVLAAGCADGRASSAPRLAGGSESLEGLGAGVWEAIVRRDTAALERLRLTEREHNGLVWPEQPAAREPTAAANLDFWWRNIQLRNRAAVADLLAAHGGSALELAGVECDGPPRPYRTYRALTDCALVLRGPGGAQRVRAFRHVIEMDGRYKVVRYYGQE